MGSSELQSQTTRRIRSDQLAPPGLRPATIALRYLICLCFSLESGILFLAPALAQVTGDAAEMERLRVRAEEAIGNDDPDGAAMSMGRAALMAKRLGLLNKDEPTVFRFYQGGEALFRSQEHGYRAIALFRRAGGQLPASSGVCGSLAMAQGSLDHAQSDLRSDISLPDPLSGHLKQWRETADNWSTALASVIADYQCQ